MSYFMNETGHFYEENIELEEGEIIDNEAIGSRTELHRMGLNVGGWRKPTHRVQRYDLSRTFFLCMGRKERNDKERSSWGH